MLRLIRHCRPTRFSRSSSDIARGGKTRRHYRTIELVVTSSLPNDSKEISVERGNYSRRRAAAVVRSPSIQIRFDDKNMHGG